MNAGRYVVARSASPTFAGNCELHTTTETSWYDPEVPSPGAVLYYLTRPLTPFPGSWGETSAAVERFPSCGGESDCADGIDNDGDALTDCEDIESCFAVEGCDTATFYFTDTAADDVGLQELGDFFSSVVLVPTDHIRFAMSGDSLTDFEWCAERADFYQDRYLALAPTGGQDYSLGWDAWFREEGGSWLGPIAAFYQNLYGDQCAGPYSWCAELALGSRGLAVNPADASVCEAMDLAVGCGDGSWAVTITVGLDRASTCGF